MTREDKRQNKEHCKYMPFDVRAQCWWARNLDIIAPILSSAAGVTIVCAIMILFG